MSAFEFKTFHIYHKYHECWYLIDYPDTQLAHDEYLNNHPDVHYVCYA